MSRPKLIARITFRLPEELEADLQAAAMYRSCSANEVILNALENELARYLTYRLNYYADIRPIMQKERGDIGGQLPRLADTIPIGHP